MAPILVYSTLLIPTNILFEAALSFLGVGVRPPTPTWGGMLSDAVQWYTIAPHFMIFPGLAIFVTVLAFNLFGDGLRDALDPADPMTPVGNRRLLRHEGVLDQMRRRPVTGVVALGAVARAGARRLRGQRTRAAGAAAPAAAPRSTPE